MLRLLVFLVVFAVSTSGCERSSDHKSKAPKQKTEEVDSEAENSDSNANNELKNESDAASAPKSAAFENMKSLLREAEEKAKQTAALNVLSDYHADLLKTANDLNAEFSEFEELVVQDYNAEEHEALIEKELVKLEQEYLSRNLKSLYRFLLSRNENEKANVILKLKADLNKIALKGIRNPRTPVSENDRVRLAELKNIIEAKHTDIIQNHSM